MKMNSKTAIFFFVATLFVAHTHADVEDKPQAGYILGGANTEFGVSSHILYVTYPGIEGEETATMEIENNGQKIHTYRMDNKTEIETPYTYFFAIRETTETTGYTVKFCKGDGTTCSKLSSPPTVMDNGEKKLDCLEKDPEVKDIEIPAVSKYADQMEFQAYKDEFKAINLATKEGITKNPSYKKEGDEKGYMYFLVYYKLSAFKQLFQAKQDDDKFCQTKYTFTVITQVVDKSTKKILKRGRFTPKPLTKKEHIEKYITNDDAKEVPIEFKLNIKQEQAKMGNLEIWQSVCVSAKDMVTSREDGFTTKCSNPLLRDWNWDSDVEQE